MMKTLRAAAALSILLAFGGQYAFADEMPACPENSAYDIACKEGKKLISEKPMIPKTCFRQDELKGCMCNEGYLPMAKEAKCMTPEEARANLTPEEREAMDKIGLAE